MPNIRPVLERENLGPARAAIHEVFLTHVMSHAPGYDKLIAASPVPILSTPHAVGVMAEEAARRRGIELLAVDIGGATTDVFSVCKGVFNRTVSANLGMSYSVSNVLLEAGIENICRWLPFAADPDQIQGRLRNKMIRPTTIPQVLSDLLVEQAVAREALRLAFQHHRSLAVGLKGIQQERTIADAFSQSATGESLISMRDIGMIIGSGGVLSHAPDRKAAALMLLDSFEPEGITELCVDSIFMMPHLGVLSSVCPEAAQQIFERDCLVYLGTSIGPVFSRINPGTPLLKYQLAGTVGAAAGGTLLCGELVRVELPPGATAEVILEPAHHRVDVGLGPGKSVTRTVRGGHAGLMFDGRGRPLELSADAEERIAANKRWMAAFGLELPGESGEGGEA